MEYRVEVLMEMAAKKAQLEDQQKTASDEYKNVLHSIEKYLDGIPKNEEQYLKRKCQFEYENSKNAYLSDVDDSLKTYYTNKMKNARVALDLIGKKQMQKPAEKTQKYTTIKPVCATIDCKKPLIKKIVDKIFGKN